MKPLKIKAAEVTRKNNPKPAFNIRSMMHLFFMRSPHCQINDVVLSQKVQTNDLKALILCLTHGKTVMKKVKESITVE
ncbi:MAG: hypothetical protein P8012_00665 [Desulfobacterales bacterium]